MNNDLDREIYLEQKAEARACGFEFPTFAEWLDPSLTRKRAEARARVRDDWDEQERD
jgi:hypothetical protein